MNTHPSMREQIEKQIRSTAQASGAAFENRIEIANQAYKYTGDAIINKREIAVSIKSNKGGKITGNLKKASQVDYEGILKGGRSIQFEAKSTKFLTRFDLSKIEEHQIEYLDAARKMGAMSFLLLEFSELRSVYVVPAEWVVLMWRDYKYGKGAASLSIDEVRHYGAYVKQSQTNPMDYLGAARDLGL